jgi:hypothetical protein
LNAPLLGREERRMRFYLGILRKNQEFDFMIFFKSPVSDQNLVYTPHLQSK